MIAIKIKDKFVPVSDELYEAVLKHASANFLHGRAKRADQTATAKAAHQAEIDLLDQVGLYVEQLLNLGVK